MSRYTLLLNNFILYIFAISAVAQSQTSKLLRSRQIGAEGQILAKILAEYDPHARPPVRETSEHSSVIVITSIYINRITWHEQHADIDMYLRQQWEDDRLKYDVDVREGIDEVSVPLNRRIWMPDTYFSSGDDIPTKDQRHVVVEPDGHVRSSEKRILSVPLIFGDRFPFSNTRKFRIRLSSYNYPIEDIVYMWANSPPIVVPVEVSEELLSGPFQFSEAVAEDCVGNYTIGAYSCIDVSIIFEGSTMEVLFKVFIPSIFLVIISWLHFWVHGSWSVPRTFSAALPFFIFVMLMAFYPQPYLTHQGVGGLQVWFLFCLLITFASFLEYFVVICCGVRRTLRYVNGATSEENPLTVARDAAENAYENKCGSIKNNNGVDLIARVLFPVIFLVFLVVFLIVYLV